MSWPLSGNVLTDETKEVLQKKLSFILHALSAAHSEIGYCQGMDYVVAHLLRLLQETVKLHAAKGTLPSCIRSVPRVCFVGNDVPDRNCRPLVANRPIPSCWKKLASV